LRGGYLQIINASAAYNQGASGQGVLVADIDTGADPNRQDLVGAISPASTDIIPGRNQPVGTDPHANFVSSVLGARFNNFGTIGVAWASTILSIRADTANPATFDDLDVANGIEYAIANHARVINLSIGGKDPSSPSFQRALSDAVAAGLAVAISAGNDSGVNPDFPGVLAADPRYSSSVIVAGATDQTGQLASFSNQAGTAASNFLVAPGAHLTADCDNGTCAIVSGTSFAAPQVAGAIALLLQAFPNLTAQQAVSILLRSADKIGPSTTFGQGQLDLAAAFQPMGTMSVPQASGATIAINSADVPGGGGLTTATTSGAIGDAISRSQGLETIGYDSYRRLYKVNLAAALRPARVQGLVAAEPAVRASQAELAGPAGLHFAFASGGVIAPQLGLPADRTFRQDADPAYTTVAAGAGPLTLVAWTGQGGVQPDLGEPRDAFQAIAQSDQVEAARLALGRLSLSGEAGTSARLAPFASIQRTGSSYARVAANFDGPGYSARVAVGELSEPFGPLGSMLTGAYASPAKTRFMTIGGAKNWGGTTVYGEASLGRTAFSSALLHAPGALASSWRAGLTDGSVCASMWRLCSHVGIELEQPLRFEGSDAVATLAEVPAHYFDALTFTQRRVSLSPSGRQLDLRLFSDRDLGRYGTLRLEAVAASQPGNIAAAPVGMGFLTTWRVGF
jgi:hypothetical protein